MIGYLKCYFFVQIYQEEAKYLLYKINTEAINYKTLLLLFTEIPAEQFVNIFILIINPIIVKCKELYLLAKRFY